jgi:hypothetical protein
MLGQFIQKEDRLEITLSHIIGGGEGVLLRVSNLFRQFGRRSDKRKIVWKVHAVDCAKPNPKLLRLLQLKNFEIVTDPIDGSIYQKVELL